MMHAEKQALKRSWSLPWDEERPWSLPGGQERPWSLPWDEERPWNLPGDEEAVKALSASLPACCEPIIKECKPN